MRVVLDSNIPLSALISRLGPPHAIYQAWRRRRFELVSATVQLDELRRASRYPKLRGILQPHRVGRMLNKMQGATVLTRLHGEPEAADPFDAWLLALADTAELAEFVASLGAARAEGERDGFLSAEDVHQQMTAMLDEMARTTRR
jgi:predicted nucleic acid-binding protein